MTHTEGELRAFYKSYVKNHEASEIACHMGLSERDFNSWLKGRNIRSIYLRNARIMTRKIKDGQAFTDEEFISFWTYIERLQILIKKGKNLISEGVLIDIAMTYDSDSLQTWQSIYHYLAKCLAWVLFKNYSRLNISLANRIILSGKDTYQSYLDKKSSKSDYNQLEPFQYLERVFLQYRYDKVPAYLWNTKAFPNLRFSNQPILSRSTEDLDKCIAELRQTGSRILEWSDILERAQEAK